MGKRIYNPATNEYGTIVGQFGAKLLVRWDGDSQIHEIARNLVELV